MEVIKDSVELTLHSLLPKVDYKYKRTSHHARPRLPHSCTSTKHTTITPQSLRKHQPVWILSVIGSCTLQNPHTHRRGFSQPLQSTGHTLPQFISCGLESWRTLYGCLSSRATVALLYRHPTRPQLLYPIFFATQEPWYPKRCSSRKATDPTRQTSGSTHYRLHHPQHHLIQ